MSLSNENNPMLLSIALGSPTADKVVPAGYFPKKSKIVAAYIQNGAALAQSDTNYLVGQLLNGSVKVAQVSTKLTGGDAALVANVALAMNIDPDSVSADEIAAGTSLKFSYDETDAGSNVALTDAQLIIEFYPY